MSRSASRGFTLIEMVIVMLVITIMSAYAFAKNGSPSVYSIKSQADTLAADIRHIQSLSMNWGRSLRITRSSTGYTVSCVTSGTSPCNSSTVTNPTTGSSYAVTLANSMTISGPSTLDIDNFGQPSTAASYTINAGTTTFTVAVAAITGKVTVSSP